ncbi:DUF5753 domain-containing protein [Lentzea sp. NPDC034063]|uniref:DUF5753 domain-containing protein n=1 Tax=unclassified Lentzea TaxID=2643253 RepID=UPI0033D934DA
MERPQATPAAGALKELTKFDLFAPAQGMRMPKRYSTARGREFGAGVRAAIGRTAMTSREVAEKLKWQEAKVSDMVNGKGGVSLLDITLLLGFCQSPADEREHLLALYPETHREGWLQEHGKCTPIRPHTVCSNLAAAKSLVGWQPHVIPTFLRTTAYMCALLTSSATVQSEEFKDRLGAMQELQQLPVRGLDCTFYIHELALDLQVGELEVHVDQLLHLLVLSNRKRIKIHVVPTSAGAHAGVAGPFTHLSFTKYESLVLLEPENSSIFIEQPEAVAGYESVIEALSKTSLDEAESRALISVCTARLKERLGDPFPSS